MSLNILVVDDSLVVRSMIIKTLRIAGVPVGQAHQAANGQEGLEIIRKEWIDLLFVDINMPVMNGEEMIERIRENDEWADLPIIVVSTEGSQTRIERLVQKGARFIHKPFSPECVREVVQDLLGITLEQSAQGVGDDSSF